jgi:uncharacterized protein (TIGR03435 family)
MSNKGAIFSAEDISVKSLIIFAYRVLRMQISGGPDWLDTAKFDIEAKRPEGSVGEGTGTILRDDKLSLMLQSLLADRFRLAFHRETKELPVYALVLAKAGPKLKEAVLGGDPGAFKGVAPEFKGVYHGQDADGPALFGKEASMSELAHTLSGSPWVGLDRFVIDATGLKGVYDFKVSVSAAPDSDPDAPSIFTVLESHLGLKLESRKGPMEMLVIDHAEKPSDN